MLNPFKLLKIISAFIQNENAKYIGNYYIFNPLSDDYPIYFKVISNISKKPDEITVLGFIYNGTYAYTDINKQFYEIICEGKLDTFPFEVKNLHMCKQITEEQFTTALTTHINNLLQYEPQYKPY